MRMRSIDVAEPAGQHDRLVVATQHAADFRFERTEVAAQVRPAELVVEGSGADGTLEHDVERRRDAAGLARRRAFPELLVPRDAQVRDRVADESRFRLRAPPGRAFVADLAAGAGRGPRERRDRRRVIVRLDLHHRMHVRGVPRVHAVGARMEALRVAPLHDGRVVGIRDHGAAGAHRVRVPDHGEERLRLLLAVDDPVGVEDLVAAMLGVRLGEHGELGVAGIAAERAIGALEVFDLVLAQRKAELGIGCSQRRQWNMAKRPRRHVLEELRRLVEGREHGLGHAVVEQCGNAGLGRVDGERRAALDALHGLEAAVAGDVGRLRRPGRDRAEARHDQVGRALQRGCGSPIRQ